MYDTVASVKSGPPKVSEIRPFRGAPPTVALCPWLQWEAGTIVGYAGTKSRLWMSEPGVSALCHASKINIAASASYRGSAPWQSQRSSRAWKWTEVFPSGSCQVRYSTYAKYSYNLGSVAETRTFRRRSGHSSLPRRQPSIGRQVMVGRSGGKQGTLAPIWPIKCTGEPVD